MNIEKEKLETIPHTQLSEDNDALVTFLNGMMDKASTLVSHFDTQINILVGISTGLIALSATILKNGGGLFAGILLFFSAGAMICGLYALHPPKFMRKRGQLESLFYNKKIIEFDSATDYAEALANMLQNRGSVIKECSTEIFNLYKYHYRPKRKLFKLSRDLLFWGIILSFVTYFLQ